MEENRVPDRIFGCLLNLNFLIVLFLAGVIARSIAGFVHENTALSFLGSIQSVTLAPWKIPVTVCLLYGSFLLLLKVENESNALFYIRTGLEMIAGLFICYLLHYSYTGIMLLVLADVTRRLAKERWKFVVIGLIGGFYLLMDYHLVPQQYRMASLESCLLYYRGDIRSLLLGIRNVLASLNILGFIVYILALMRLQMSEKERILNLNERLNEANTQLKEANRHLEEYALESVKNAETRERNRLAREIHDTLGHTLTGIIAGLDACTMLVEVAPEAVKEQLTVISEVARNGMTDVRRSVKALRPDALEKLELEKALLQTIEEMRKATGAEIRYECKAALQNFNKDEEEIIYRIVQESITNSIRHGKADKIWISIDREYQMMKIVVKDNGIGCKEIQKGFGLHHMEERLALLQGHLHCSGEKGFLLEAEIPIRWGEE